MDIENRMVLDSEWPEEPDEEERDEWWRTIVDMEYDRYVEQKLQQEAWLAGQRELEF